MLLERHAKNSTFASFRGQANSILAHHGGSWDVRDRGHLDRTGADALTCGAMHRQAVLQQTMKRVRLIYFQVSGVLYYVDTYGKHLGYEDVFTKIGMCHAHFENVGPRADFVQQFIC